MAILTNLNPISTRRMTWIEKTKTFCIEASDLGHCGDEIFRRLYDDACDVGLVLESHVTGKRSAFYLHDEIRDHEGELQYYELLPTPEALRVNPRLSGVRVVVFGD